MQNLGMEPQFQKEKKKKSVENIMDAVKKVKNVLKYCKNAIYQEVQSNYNYFS